MVASVEGVLHPALSLDVEQPDTQDVFRLNDNLVMGGVRIKGDGEFHLVEVEEPAMDEELTFRMAAAVPSLDAQDGVAGRGHP